MRLREALQKLEKETPDAFQKKILNTQQSIREKIHEA